MRYLPLFLLVFGSCRGGEPAYPLWDGHESLADYAKRVNLPATKTLDLGSGVKLELVLIPAGKFIMGTPRPTEPTDPPKPPESPEPSPVDEDGFRNQILIGQLLLAVSVVAWLGMLFVIIRRGYPQARSKAEVFTLLSVLLMTLIVGGSGLYWRQSARKLEEARSQYSAAKERFDAERAAQHTAAKKRFDAAWEQYTAAKARFDVAEKRARMQPASAKAQLYAMDDPWQEPSHRVTMTKPFYMGKYDVTQEQYQQMIGSNPSTFKGKDNPVETVSLGDALMFCMKFSEQSNQTVELPTEAEWEFACRAGTITTYYSGDTDKDLDRVAWYDANGKHTTHPVGQKEPNAFGLYDMHGNAWQWCYRIAFWFADQGNSEAELPQLCCRACAVLRGGSWEEGPAHCWSACRFQVQRDTRAYNIGFRVVVPAFKTP